jgi:hypothetical protein
MRCSKSFFYSMLLLMAISWRDGGGGGGGDGLFHLSLPFVDPSYPLAGTSIVAHTCFTGFDRLSFVFISVIEFPLKKYHLPVISSYKVPSGYVRC